MSELQETAVATGTLQPPARSLHRLAVLLVGLVWPLIWIGGMVTTYDAGMSVPDWPGTYGYNLFLYPYETWLFGPFDLFIEHGHRLLAAVVGMISIGLLVAAAVQEPRRWVIALAGTILLVVIAQGVLGGMRVVLDERTLAMIHGCTAPAVFALCVGAAVVTSRWWWQPRKESRESSGEAKKIGRSVPRLVGVLVAIAYGQLVLGAQLRHVPATMDPSGFAHLVLTHVAVAALLWLWCAAVWLRVRRCGDLTLSRPGLLLIGLMAIQIVLGTGTWVVNYGWPAILQWVPGSAGFVIQSKRFADSLVITAHVATGSLILGVSVLMLLRVLRLRHVRAASLRRDEAAREPAAAAEPEPLVASGAV